DARGKPWFCHRRQSPKGGVKPRDNEVAGERSLEQGAARGRCLPETGRPGAAAGKLNIILGKLGCGLGVSLRKRSSGSYGPLMSLPQMDLRYANTAAPWDHAVQANFPAGAGHLSKVGRASFPQLFGALRLTFVSTTQLHREKAQNRGSSGE